MADYGMLMSEATGGDSDGKTDMYLHVVHEPAHPKSQWTTLLGGETYSAYFSGFAADVAPYLRMVPSPHPPYTTQGQCADGIDNDGDLKIDYPADSGCSSAYGDDSESDTSTQYLSADVNQDTFINIKDIQICVKVITGALTNPRADVNGDGVKNIKDIQQIVKAIIG
jgi:hypothetical protein